MHGLGVGRQESGCIVFVRACSFMGHVGPFLFLADPNRAVRLYSGEAEAGMASQEILYIVMDMQQCNSSSIFRV